MNQKQVLLYGFGPDTDGICAEIKNYGIEPVVVTDSQLDQTVGFLCGVPGFREKKRMDGGPVPQSMMLFRNLPQEELNAVLDDLRSRGLGIGSLKAMVTPTNQQWTVRALLEEIQQEHQVMEALIRLRKIRSRVVELNPMNFRLMQAVVHAESLFSGTREVTVEEVEAACRELSEFVGK